MERYFKRKSMILSPTRDEVISGKNNHSHLSDCDKGLNCQNSPPSITLPHFR